MRLTPKQHDALRLIADGRFYPDFVNEDGEWYARWRPLADEENVWVDEFVREAAMTRLTEDAEDQKHATLHDAWMMALKSMTGLVRWDDAECAAFAAEIKEWNGSAKEDVEARRAITFHLVHEKDSFVIRCSVPYARRELHALGLSMFTFPPLRGLARGDNPSGDISVALSQAEAESFVRSGARELRDAGYCVEGVDLAATITAEAELEADEKRPKRGLEKAVALRLTVRVDGESVTAEEIRFLLDQGSALVFFRNRWIEVNRDILRQALRALEKQSTKTVSPLTFAFGLGRIGPLELAEAKAHGWLRGLVNELRQRHSGDLVNAPELIVRLEKSGFVGTLRDYQLRGIAWLEFLTTNGFGALLADDMGLGKTVQTIAWTLALGAGRPLTKGHALRSHFLIVAPLTLLSNWRHEFARFAPGLSVYVHQGEHRPTASGFRMAVHEADIVITSYTLLVKDYTLFSGFDWAGLVLDEAQTVKNPDTQAAKAVRALTPSHRIALTGTPIENSVEDIWAIEDFLNPGFLGERKSFEDRFVKPLALDEQSAAGKRLRTALEPFVLRRLKSDPAIAAELGEKREIKEYCPLTPSQRSDYERALQDFRVNDRRQGDVFALITNLKIICDGLSDDKVSGGKLDRLCDLLDDIFNSGESALVFTQYAKVGAAIQRALTERFGRKFPFLHGGLSAHQRETEIARFNQMAERNRLGTPSPNAFILSLKAGGFGLNLTKATHVIHYDRWWNPAVENQATDRAHRLGQERTVFVHQFISVGTLEEHVDALLEHKSRVAGTLVQSGEGFLSILSPDELNAALALDRCTT